MNVVIFGKGFGKPRQINLSGVVAGSVATVFAVVVAVAGFAAGHWYSSLTGSGVSSSELTDLTGALAEQRDEIHAIRQGNEDKLAPLFVDHAKTNTRKLPIEIGQNVADRIAICVNLHLVRVRQ